MRALALDDVAARILTYGAHVREDAAHGRLVLDAEALRVGSASLGPTQEVSAAALTRTEGGGTQVTLLTGVGLGLGRAELRLGSAAQGAELLRALGFADLSRPMMFALVREGATGARGSIMQLGVTAVMLACGGLVLGAAHLAGLPVARWAFFLVMLPVAVYLSMRMAKDATTILTLGREGLVLGTGPDARAVPLSLLGSVEAVPDGVRVQLRSGGAEHLRTTSVPGGLDPQRDVLHAAIEAAITLARGRTP